MRAPTFEYAVLRVVPRVERGERVNAGVFLYCRARDFLDAAVHLDRARAAALDRALDLDEVQEHLEAVVRVCRGGADAGPLAGLSQAERFRWLAAPRSTVVQPGPVHEGFCEDPAAELRRLFAALVLPPEPH